MITKIDKYIAKNFIKTLLFVILIFTMISIIIDFVEKVEDFYEEDVTVWYIITDYYIPFIAWINTLLLPLYILIAVIFFTSRMANNYEIISIFNAGVSFNRLLIPFMVTSVIVAGLHFANNHYYLPKSNKKRLDFEHTYIWKYSDKGKSSMVHMFLNPNTKVFIRYFSKKDTSARDLRLERFEGGKLVEYMVARNAKWIGPDNTWQLSKIRYTDINDDGSVSVRVDNKTKIDTVINISIKDFVQFDNQKEMMTSPEINVYVEKTKQRGLSNTLQFEVEVYRRTADAFTIIILTLLGVAIASRKERGGIGFQLALGIALGALFIFLSKFSLTFATSKYFIPLIGVWIPNIIFFIISLFLVNRAQK